MVLLFAVAVAAPVDAEAAVADASAATPFVAAADTVAAVSTRAPTPGPKRSLHAS